jgi:hypothetical protein
MLGPVVVVCLQACQLVFRKLNMQLQVFPRDYRANFVFNMRFFFVTYQKYHQLVLCTRTEHFSNYLPLFMLICQKAKFLTSGQKKSERGNIICRLCNSSNFTNF